MGDGPQGSFQTHAQYLRALNMLYGHIDPGQSNSSVLQSLATRLVSTERYQNLQKVTVDCEKVEQSLRNAWGTELLLCLSGEYASEDELLKLVNNWSVVQVYYILYHVTQALVVAHGHPRPDSHSTTKNLFVEEWLKRPVQLPPWSLGADDHGRYCNLPQGREIRDVHQWKTCTTENCWDIAAVALRTTRKDQLMEKQKEAREEKRRKQKRIWKREEEKRLQAGRSKRKEPKFALPRLTSEEKKEQDEKLRPYGLIDYFWRLRIKTNYEDSSMFTDGPTQESQTKRVHSDLVELAVASLLVHEIFLCKLLGKDEFMKLMTKWSESNVPRGQQGRIHERIALLRDKI